MRGRNLLSLAVILASLMLAGCGQGETRTAFRDPLYRPPLGASGIGVGYGVLSVAKDDRILSVGSPFARAVEIHTMVQEGDSSRMQRVEGLELHAGEDVVFSPGGMHIMIIDPDPLPLPNEPAATFPIQFQFESGTTLRVGFRAEVTKP